MIELTLDTGKKVTINIFCIRQIYQNDENKCTIFFSDEDYVKPQESYTAVKTLIATERDSE